MGKRKAKQGLDKKEEPELTVKLRLSVARDLVTVLAKFSDHKMTLLQVGQREQATRLLNLNLFRISVGEAMRKHGY